MTWHVVNVPQTIRQIRQPFMLAELAAVGEIVLHGYICLGAINWHKHIDNDEAFLVIDGGMALESEWGHVMLHTGELAVIPKGIAHRSGAQLRTLVMLMHTRGMPERKNGQRRIFGLPGAGQITKIQLHQLAEQTDSFIPEPVANVDDYTLQLVTGDGYSTEYINWLSDVAWLTLRGQARFEIEDETVELNQGDLIVVPCGIACHWFGFGHTTLLWLGLTQSLIYD